jgi:hypothetical protein
MSATPGICVCDETIESSAATGADASIEAPNARAAASTKLLTVAFNCRDRENFMADILSARRPLHRSS